MNYLVSVSLILLLNCAHAFDHTHNTFNQVLLKHVTFKGPQSYVTYKSLKKNPKDLIKYLNSLSKVTLSEYNQFDSNQKLAFLINAYNAFTLKLIIDHYPVKSIKDIGGIFSNPWKKKFFKLFGKKSFLDQIEHGMIRKQFNEPRIHFAVNCASIGCPSLLKVAFNARDLESQLSYAEGTFLNDKSKNYYDKNSNTLSLSKIFDWYGGDFEKVHDSVKNYIAKKIAKNVNEKKSILEKSTIQYTKYDWNLNELK